MIYLQSIVPPEASDEQVRLLIWIGTAVVMGLVAGMAILWGYLAKRETRHDAREETHTKQVQMFADEIGKFRAVAEDTRVLLQKIHEEGLRNGGYHRPAT